MQRFFTSVFFAFTTLAGLSGSVSGCAEVEDELSPDQLEAEGGDDADTLTQELSAGRRICSWNIRRLGNNFEKQAKDFDATAKVIRDNCDLVAVQETMVTISQSGTNTGGFDSLMSTLGSRYWGGVITDSPVPNPPTSSSEYYAFIFRKSAVSSCSGPNGAKVASLDDPEDVFIREPAYACFRLKDYPRELVVASYHALFGSPVERRREVSFLDEDLDGNGEPDDLFAAMKASRPGGNPDVLLLGDFNLGAKELADALPGYVDLTIGNGSTINASNEVTANQYDHAVVPPDSRLLANTAPAQVLDVRNVAKAGSNFFTTVSDHLPIRLVLK